MTQHQEYFVPAQSKLPITTAAGIAIAAYGAASAINAIRHEQQPNWLMLIVGLLVIITCMYVWFRETIRENHSSLHSPQLKMSYRLGMQWFIFSEVMFFAAFFGALFYIKYYAMPWLASEGNGEMNKLLWPEFENGWPWSPIVESFKHLFSLQLPPEPLITPTPQEAMGGVAAQQMANNGSFQSPHHLVSPWRLPLLNTMLLLSSSFTVNWAHHAIKDDNLSRFKAWMLATLALGFVFIGVQIYEYYEAYHHLGLTLESGVYGSTFFMLTGFHGFHVCMGAFILSIQLIRGWRAQFSSKDHFGFEAGAWYWHFVDVVWIFLFFVVYLGWDQYAVDLLKWIF